MWLKRKNFALASGEGLALACKTTVENFIKIIKRVIQATPQPPLPPRHLLPFFQGVGWSCFVKLSPNSIESRMASSLVRVADSNPTLHQCSIFNWRVFPDLKLQYAVALVSLRNTGKGGSQKCYIPFLPKFQENGWPAKHSLTPSFAH